MFDPAKPVRHRNHSDKVEIVATINSDCHNSMMLLVVTTNASGRQRVGYRTLSGAHPNGVEMLDLVNVDISAVANVYHTMNSKVANAVGLLWAAGERRSAIDAMMNLNQTLIRVEVEKYFESLWG